MAMATALAIQDWTGILMVHDASGKMDGLMESSTTFLVANFNMLLTITFIVMAIVFSGEPLASIWISLGQNTFIKNIPVYTFYSSYKDVTFMGGVVLVFMGAIAAMASYLAMFLYESHAAVNKKVRDWSHGSSIILYSFVIALGFLISATILGERSDLTLIFSFLIIVMAPVIFVMVQMNFAALPYTSKHTYDLIVLPVVAGTFQLVPWINLLVQISMYLVNNTTWNLSNSGIANVIGSCIFALFFYIPMVMSTFTKLKWTFIESFFGVFILVFNIYVFVTYYCYVLV